MKHPGHEIFLARGSVMKGIKRAIFVITAGILLIGVPAGARAQSGVSSGKSENPGSFRTEPRRMGDHTIEVVEGIIEGVLGDMILVGGEYFSCGNARIINTRGEALDAGAFEKGRKVTLNLKDGAPETVMLKTKRAK
jgi:hypothetical protein